MMWFGGFVAGIAVGSSLGLLIAVRVDRAVRDEVAEVLDT